MPLTWRKTEKKTHVCVDGLRHRIVTPMDHQKKRGLTGGPWIEKRLGPTFALGRAPSDAAIASLKELEMGRRDITELTSSLQITKTMTETGT